MRARAEGRDRDGYIFSSRFPWFWRENTSKIRESFSIPRQANRPIASSHLEEDIIHEESHLEAEWLPTVCSRMIDKFSVTNSFFAGLMRVELWNCDSDSVIRE